MTVNTRRSGNSPRNFFYTRLARHGWALGPALAHRVCMSYTIQASFTIAHWSLDACEAVYLTLLATPIAET